MTKGPVQQEMESLLAGAFPDADISLSNDSERHLGHAGHDGSGESHFTIRIISPDFVGKSRVDRQRMVNRALGDIPGNRVHALAITAKAPGE